MTAGNGALTVVVSTRRLDDESPVLAKVVVLPVAGEARVLNATFEDSTHARVLVNAATALVRLSGERGWQLRVVLPDRVVVALLNGDIGGENGIGHRIAALQRKAKELGADCAYEYGTLHTLLGEQAPLVDLW